MTRPPADQTVRERVVRDFDTTFLLEAGAGTGKTTVLVRRIVALLRAGRTRIERVAAVSFTEKAAGELKLRLREALETGAATATYPNEGDRLQEAAAALDRALITTIHSFALALLKERPFEAGLDPEFRVAADVKGERSFDEAWDDWLDARLSAGDPDFVDALHLGTGLEDLREAARTVVAERDILGQRMEEGPAAGADALRATVARTAQRVTGVQHRCKDETDGAFASISALRAFAERASRASGPALRSLLLSLKIDTQKGNQKAWADKDTLRIVKDQLKALKEEKATFERQVHSRTALRLRNRLGEFLAAFEARQREDALIDFQGLLLEARNLLRDKLAVRRYFQDRFDALLIDEFQDTDPLQVEIAFFLAEEAQEAPAADWRKVRLTPGKLFLVGDPKQSIYRFRRADLGIYRQAKEQVKAGGGEVLALISNFRTVPSIAAFVNERFREAFRTDPEHDPDPIPLKAERAEMMAEGARVLALPVPPERLPENPAEDRLDTLRPLVAAAIAGFVDDVTRRRPWSVRHGDSVRPARPGDVGLLVRNLTGIEHLEEALRARDIGYRLVGGKAYHQRGEVAELRAVLLAIDNAADRLALVQALRSPFFSLSDDDLARFVAKGGLLTYNAPISEALAGSPVAAAFEILQRLHRQRRIDPPSAIVRGLFERTRALPAFLLSRDGAQAVANLWKVAEIAQAYEAAGPATLRGFVRFLAQQAQEAREEGDSPVGDESGQNVEILSVHRAKGLEYPIVVLADIFSSPTLKDRAFLDHARGLGWLKVGSLAPPGFEEQKAVEKAKQEAEERRLLYVATTRARDHLVLPVLPVGRGKWGGSWTAPALGAVARTGEPPYGEVAPTRLRDGSSGKVQVTWIDSRAYFPPPDAAAGPRPADALSGGDAEAQAAGAAQQAWDEARKARRHSARGPAGPSPAAVTDVAAGAGRSPRGGDDDPAAARFGKLVHALLARVPLDGSGVEVLAQALAPDFALDADRAASAAALVRQTLAQPLFDRVRKSDRVLRETPIAATLDGQRVNGVIDLAFLEGGRFVVVEYKTGHAGGTSAAKGQLLLYGRSLQAATGASVVVEPVVVG